MGYGIFMVFFPDSLVFFRNLSSKVLRQEASKQASQQGRKGGQPATKHPLKQGQPASKQASKGGKEAGRQGDSQRQGLLVSKPASKQAREDSKQASKGGVRGNKHNPTLKILTHPERTNKKE